MFSKLSNIFNFDNKFSGFFTLFPSFFDILFNKYLIFSVTSVAVWYSSDEYFIKLLLEEVNISTSVT